MKVYRLAPLLDSACLALGRVEMNKLFVKVDVSVRATPHSFVKVKVWLRKARNLLGHQCTESILHAEISSFTNPMIWPAGPMARRLTTTRRARARMRCDQEIAGSIPA